MASGFYDGRYPQERYRESVRDLGVRLMTQQEEERKRVARELHDDLSQRMAIFCIDIESLIQKGAIAQADLEAELGQISTRAKEISAEIHRVAYALHPAKLDDLGLKSALNSYCNEVARPSQDRGDLSARKDSTPASRQTLNCASFVSLRKP